MKTAWQEDAVCKNRNDGDGSMHRTENVELTVVCLLEDGGKVLLQNRKKRKTGTVGRCRAGMWRRENRL